MSVIALLYVVLVIKLLLDKVFRDPDFIQEKIYKMIFK